MPKAERLWRRFGRAALPAALLLLPCLPLGGAQLEGTLFEDLDHDGIQDPGEPPVEGAWVRVAGTADAGGTVSDQVQTGPDGSYAFALSEGCYLLEAAPGPDARMGPARTDCPSGPYPVGTRRIQSANGLLDRVLDGGLYHYALGDSIAQGVSFCLFDDTNYHDDVHEDRVRCLVPPAVLDNEAQAGHTTFELLRDPFSAGDGNTALDAIAAGPDLVTISIGGNDFLDMYPGAADPPDPASAVALETCAARLFAAVRANGQEALSSLTAGLPGAHMEINTVYDNLARACASSSFHNRWIPVGNHIFRSLAWGQTRRATVAEVWADYARMNVQGTECCGFEDMICTAIFDGIHPNADGRRIHENRLFDAFGGALLGPRDDIGATTIAADLGILRRVGSVLPTQTEVRPTQPVPGLDDLLVRGDDSGALVPFTASEVRASGFEAPAAGVTLERAVVNVRYRGVGTHVDDLYWFEASFDPAFPPPGDTITTWDTVVPIVGASRTIWTVDTDRSPWTCNGSAPSGALVLLDPAPSDWRHASALLTRNLEDPDPADGTFDFPKVGLADLENLTVRIRTEAVGPVDNFTIEWDAAWVDLYGTAAPAPDLSAATKDVRDASTGDPVREAAVGRVLTYVIEFANEGTAPATGVVFRDTLDSCLAFESGPLLDGAPSGTFDGTTVEVTVGDVPADGIPHEIRFEVRVTAGCSGREVENVGLLVSAEVPGGDATDDPATPADGDPTVFTVPGGPLRAAYEPGLLADPTPADPYDCAEARLDPTRDACASCVQETPDLWSVAGGAGWSGEGLVLYEIPGRGCPSAGDAQVLCLRPDGSGGLFLELAPAGGGC